MDLTQASHQIFLEAKESLEKNGFTIVQQDLTRPWGGFFVIDENPESFSILTIILSVECGESFNSSLHEI